MPELEQQFKFKNENVLEAPWIYSIFYLPE